MAAIPLFSSLPTVGDPPGLSGERRAAIVAACVKAADRLTADQQRCGEAARQAADAVRSRYEAIFAAIDGQQIRLPIMAGMVAGLPLPLVIREAPPRRREEVRDVGPVTSYDQALYLLSRGWKPGSDGPTYI